MSSNKVQALPVNIISGFLGVGKTTAIRHLLSHKPADEHWAVLINEMGEIGIDGSLVATDGVAVRQVAGGCMCCVSDLPSKVALNALIREHRPDRILIEPSGIASPKTILKTYRSEEYRNVLEVRATVCLIDPWMLSQPEFTELSTFQEQLQLADVLLASKSDVASEASLQGFFQTAAKYPDIKITAAIQQGAIEPQWLDFPATDRTTKAGTHHHHHHHSENQPQEESLPVVDADGITRHENHSAEAWACGWLFPADQRFDRAALEHCLSITDVPRIKGLLRTSEGWLAFNRMRQHSSSEPTAATDDGQSALEMISMQPTDWLAIQKALKQCLIKHS